MTPPAPVTFSLDADRVGWLVFDAAGDRPPVLDAACRAALTEALDQAAAGVPRAVVVTGGNGRVFLGGGDRAEMAALPDPAAARAYARTGQRLLARLADFPVPVVAAWEGVCSSAGYELALACHWRIAADAPATRIGLPETDLGVIPGWGGTVRLARLLGAVPAIRHLLDGRLPGAAEALAAGLVDAVVPAAELRQRAAAAARRLAEEGRPVRPPASPPDPDAIAALREEVRTGVRARYPALRSVIEVVAEGAGVPLPDALAWEAQAFGELAAGEVAKNLMHVSAVGEAARRRTLAGWFPVPVPPAPAVRRIGVVGAGVMGAGIAQWCASRGYDVVLRDVRPEALARGLAAIRAMGETAVRRGRMTAAEAAAAQGRIAATTGWEGFADCDLIVEAIVEDVAAKRTLFRELAGVARADVVLTSNSSALPIEAIAGEVPHPARTLGLHFFNPVGRMPLVELVLGPQTGAAAAGQVLRWLQAIGKAPVVCRSSPGFLVTRVLFFYLNAAVRRWEDGVPAAAIEAALRDFGWPMGPLRLIDEVGLDVTVAIFAELERSFPHRFRRSSACDRLLAAGRRGRKGGGGAGFHDGGGRETVDEAALRAIVGGAAGPAAAPPDLAAELMDVMAAEAQRCLDEGVVRSPDDIDFALLSGAGFPKFRGGLMRWARAATAAVSRS